MIVCVCNNLSDNVIIDYKKDYKRLRELMQDYEISCFPCKKCLPYLKEGFGKEKDEEE